MIKSHNYNELPNRHTGAIIVSETSEFDSDLCIMRIAEYSTLHGWDNPPSPDERWVYEDDITSLIRQ